MFFCPNVFLYAAIVVVAFLSMLMVGGGCVKLLPELYFEQPRLQPNAWEVVLEYFNSLGKKIDELFKR